MLVGAGHRTVELRLAEHRPVLARMASAAIHPEVALPQR